MISHAVLPHILAVINTLTIIVLSVGYRRVRLGDVAGHRATMSGAIALGCAFLAIYLYYHFGAGLAKFGGQGIVRPIYFTILVVHILMAAVAAVVVPIGIVHGLKGRFDRHRAIMRRALPLWLFVSVSGIVVYVMTIHIYPYQGS